MSDNCVLCKKKVFAMEKKTVAGKTYHQSCFKCKSCGTTLREKFDDHGGDVYCNRCYMEKFVDDDTKAEVEHQMNAYAKKQTHLTAKSMLPSPGGLKGPAVRSPPAVQPRGAPPVPARNGPPTGGPKSPPPPPAGAPMKAIPLSLSSAIKKAAGSPR